ncbi:MAG: cyclic nucleotide-binding domain-containing protein [Pseudomonadota bacterium]
MKPEYREALGKVGRQVRFEDGATIRHRGIFAPDFFLITAGDVDCVLSDASEITVRVGPDGVVGEIGFLTGRGASAELVAVGEVHAIAVDALAVFRLQDEMPGVATGVLRYLAEVMESRVDENDTLLSDVEAEPESTFEILRCATPDLLHTARQVRYDVYCGEFGRSSPYADPDAGTLIDDFDQTGTSFVAYHEGEAVGTVRVNAGRDGDFGLMTELYGIAESAFTTEESVIITKYAIREAFRGGTTYLRLFSAIAGYTCATDAKAIFIDCVPKLARFYATMGFERTAPDFVHHENGLSVPMVLDIAKYLGRMSLTERQRRNRWR